MILHLPREILIEILSNLPAKSIGRCRCVSKSWKNLLSTPQFIESHLSAKTHEQNLILIAPSHSILTVPTFQIGVFSTKLDAFAGTWTAVIGSCYGLVLLLNDEDEKFLVNPTTMQRRKIPDSSLALYRPGSFSMHGFGHDSCSGDYKIVTLSYYDTDNEYEPDCADTFVDVYSVKRGAWKRLDSSPFDHAVPDLAAGAFVKGAVHWLASSREPGYRSVIAAFDLAREVFDEMPAPKTADEQKFVFNKLAVLGGCLCMIDTIGSDQACIWTMKEYGVADSWTKFVVVGGDLGREIVRPLCFGGDDRKVVVLTEGEELVVYDMKEESVEAVVIDGAPAMVLDGGTFVESLVFPAL